MKIIKTLLIQLFILTACNANGLELYESKEINKTPSPFKKLIQANENKCFKLYNTKKIWILEQHCSNNKSEQGLYIFDSAGMRQFNWYDKHFNNWAWQEGCNTDKDCYYKVTINENGEITDFIYYFYINLNEGFYKIKIENNNLIISEKKIIDHPS